MQKTIYWLVGAIVVVIIVVVAALAIRGASQPTNSINQVVSQSVKEEEATAGGQIGEAQQVAISVDGFNPASLGVKKRTSVRFTNQSGKPAYVASNPHPIHTDLPEFQSGNLDTNDSFEFKFDKTGTWGYHDHLNPAVRGTIIVTE